MKLNNNTKNTKERNVPIIVTMAEESHYFNGNYRKVIRPSSLTDLISLIICY